MKDMKNINRRRGIEGISKRGTAQKRKVQRPKRARSQRLIARTAEREDGELNVGRLFGVETRSASVISTCGSDDAKGATPFCEGRAAGKLSGTEEGESDGEEEEHGSEGGGGLECREEHDEGEGEPGQQLRYKGKSISG